MYSSTRGLRILRILQSLSGPPCYHPGVIAEVIRSLLIRAARAAMGFLMIAVTAALVLGCGSEAEPLQPRRAEKLPVPRATRGYILISIDTLRADHLGCYGYPHPSSPFLDSLARRATLFEEAYAQFPSTLVSHMSMLTGLYPREHGVLPPNSVLSPEVEMLPEVFQRHGFRTAGITEGGFVSGRYGFRRGFDVFVSRNRGRNRPLEGTFRRGVDFLEGLRPDDRFFLFLHTYAVHAPYDAPRRYREPFWPGEPPPGAIAATGPALTRQTVIGERPPQPVIGWLEALYDAGIRQTDEVLQRFFADLERLGLAGEVTVVITSDHGEEFMEHGQFNHSQLYRETLRVPLLLVHPDHRAAVRHGGVVQLIDLAPTFYELARLQPRGRPSGAGLAGLIGRPSPPRPGTAWTEGMEGMRAVYRGERRQQESLLLFDPPAESWFSRRVTLDTSGGALAFQARSFQEPRRLVVRQGREVLAEAGLTPDWTTVQVPSAQPGPLLLEADGCAELPGGDKRALQCQAFQVRGLRFNRIELYDVSRDPRQLRNLARERTRATRTLLQELLAFNPLPVAAASAQPLDPELEKSLRALGYIN
ncbi:MAG TPA: sulfatase [Thermoanaerobaculia bacterium]|nr:sulfatase [Thermoanaerobaculia bacterium]